jgi:hypothetical protein
MDEDYQALEEKSGSPDFNQGNHISSIVRKCDILQLTAHFLFPDTPTRQHAALGPQMKMQTVADNSRDTAGKFIVGIHVDDCSQSAKSLLQMAGD